MTIKRTLTVLAALFAVVLLTASLAAAGPAPKGAALRILHATKGCHTWAANGGPARASQTLTLSVNGSLWIANDDVMSHKLVELSGPAVLMQALPTPMSMGMKGNFGPATMAHMGAVTKVTLPSAGVYVFTTKPGEDYTKGVKTTGEDNVLRLVVHVR
jgi:hypothetical protein